MSESVEDYCERKGITVEYYYRLKNSTLPPENYQEPQLWMNRKERRAKASKERRAK
jgi:hypothetical protein